MPKTMLADVTDGMTVRTLAYLKQKRLQPYKGKPGSFLILTLSDRSGSLDGKVFDDAEAMYARLPERGVIAIVGRASTYQSTLGLIIESAEACDEPVAPADFMPTYDGDVTVLERKLDALIASLTDPEIALLIRTIFADPDTRQKYCTAPAAKGVHGAYIHGLLEHVVRQAHLAEAACACYPEANRDLVIAGVLLHDLGKIVEFAWEFSISYTPLGSLVGHAVICDHMICERGRELGISEATALRLRHLVLSHHGTREFGAVQVPQTLEAVILHGVDNLEAKAAHCIEMLKSGDPATMWTDYDRIEGRYWYRGETSVESPLELG